uniref:Uncharacterized protein n=1 Tax=Setaria viridis TaxID=4556 RepID=A0A4U6TIH9_SETVI|nr:hypothetical protein SEVIR_8G104400v2 [Setaria viridis]
MFNLQGARSTATEPRLVLDLLGKASRVVDMFGDEAWFNDNNNGSLEEVDEALFRLLVQLESIEHT